MFLETGVRTCLEETHLKYTLSRSYFEGALILLLAALRLDYAPDGSDAPRFSYKAYLSWLGPRTLARVGATAWCRCFRCVAGPDVHFILATGGRLLGAAHTTTRSGPGCRFGGVRVL